MKNLALFLFSLLFLTYSSVAYSAEPKQLFMQNCAMCHGVDGKGQTIIGKKYKIPDFTLASWVSQNPASKIKDDIENGHTTKAGQQVMKPFKDRLSPEEIESLVKYIQGLSVTK
jgi:cytochrome c6